MAERTRVGMSLDAFMAQFEQQPFELINGKRYPLPIEIRSHATVRNQLLKHLTFYENCFDVGEVFSRQLVVICNKQQFVASAYYHDLLFITNEKLEIQDDEKPLILIPDLVVEVISPTDKYSDVTTKVDTYLADGVKLIWIVDPQRKTITVYEGNDTGKILRIDDTLTGGNVLPNFEVAVKDIFG